MMRNIYLIFILVGLSATAQELYITPKVGSSMSLSKVYSIEGSTENVEVTTNQGSYLAYMMNIGYKTKRNLFFELGLGRFKQDFDFTYRFNERLWSDDYIHEVNNTIYREDWSYNLMMGYQIKKLSLAVGLERIGDTKSSFNESMKSFAKSTSIFDLQTNQGEKEKISQTVNKFPKSNLYRGLVFRMGYDLWNNIGIELLYKQSFKDTDFLKVEYDYLDGEKSVSKTNLRIKQPNNRLSLMITYRLSYSFKQKKLLI
jgi:opacity protein-like surface antigen